jgi:hypothetical protein
MHGPEIGEARRRFEEIFGDVAGIAESLSIEPEHVFRRVPSRNH